MKYVQDIVDNSVAFFAGIGVYYTCKNIQNWYKSLIHFCNRKSHKIIRKLPIVEKKMEAIQEELASNAFEEWEKSFDELPVEGLSPNEVLQLAETLPGNDEWNKGKVSGAVYHCGDNLTELVQKMVCNNFWSNPLHSDLFPQIRQMESDIIRMCASLYHASEVSGCVTSGGSESIILACKTYRDIGISKGIEKPEIVVLDTAHVAFDKAAGLLNVKLVKVKTDQLTCQPLWDEVEKSITENTVLLVGSAPSYSHGIVDDIRRLASFAEKQSIGFHMDACLGGFILPFGNYGLDFRIRGLTSISMDIHKYGYGPKGNSVLLYRNRNLIHNQYFVSTDWKGGIYISPTLMGSRNGSLIAGAWATMIYFGYNGYQTLANNIITTTKEICNELNKLDDIYLIGNPQVCVIALGSHTLDINEVYDYLTKHGWSLNHLQDPNSFHICITPIFIKNNQQKTFVEDVKKAVEYIKNTPTEKKEKLGPISMVYGTSQKLTEKSYVKELGIYYQDLYYSLVKPKSKNK